MDPCGSLTKLDMEVSAYVELGDYNAQSNYLFEVWWYGDLVGQMPSLVIVEVWSYNDLVSQNPNLVIVEVWGYGDLVGQIPVPISC